MRRELTRARYFSFIYLFFSSYVKRARNRSSARERGVENHLHSPFARIVLTFALFVLNISLLWLITSLIKLLLTQFHPWKVLLTRFHHYWLVFILERFCSSLSLSCDLDSLDRIHHVLRVTQKLNEKFVRSVITRQFHSASYFSSQLLQRAIYIGLLNSYF